jgi:arsenate reductase
MSNDVNIYGIKACDTMKKAMAWLSDQGINYTFHDYKKVGAERSKIEGWLKQAAWDELINKRGTTWRKLDDADKQNVDNEQALRLMLENTSLIKRPLLEVGGKIYLGFKPELYQNIFAR